ncbi:xylanaseF1 [Coprinopsis sp. MPI-PUGE-AT-0042]|nr:xylanaseF1 [Coprinopsis sp. MPI-PUGE-AT-0042]
MAVKLLAFVALAVASARAQSGAWGQCGGNGWTGSVNDLSVPLEALMYFHRLNRLYNQALAVTLAPTSMIFTPNAYLAPRCPPRSLLSLLPRPSPPSQPPATTTQPPVTSQPPASAPAPSASAGSLQAKIRNKGKIYFGSCADPGTLNIAANVAVLQKEFGQVTPENSMKWDAIEPSRGSFNWGNADTLANWATTNGKLIRGHTLVWHSQLPGWVSQINDKNTLTTAIESHAAAVAGRYAGKIYELIPVCSCEIHIILAAEAKLTHRLDHPQWDVVNEIFTEQGGLRDSVFSRVLGESFVRIAFAAARKADPNAVLYINDYNLDSDNAKTRGMVSLVNRVNTANPGTIDGLGTQAHLSANGAGGLKAALTLLAGATGAKEVAVTELDIINASANDYQTAVRSCLEVPKCVGVTVWGVSDANSWRASNNPLLFDRSYQPKAAYTAVSSLLN